MQISSSIISGYLTEDGVMAITLSPTLMETFPPLPLCDPK